MVPNRFAMLLAAIALPASAAVAKPTLTIIPQRVVYSSLLQFVDVRVQVPDNEPAFNGYLSICDTYNFSNGHRFGTTVSIKPGKDQVVRINIPGPRFNMPRYLVELSANRDFSNPAASEWSKADATNEISDVVTVVIGGTAIERDAVLPSLRNRSVPINVNSVSGVATYEPKTGPENQSSNSTMMGAPTKKLARMIASQSLVDERNWAAIRFGKAFAVVVLPGVFAPDVIDGLQAYADFGGIVIDCAGLGLKNNHNTVIRVSDINALKRVYANTDDLTRRYVSAQNANAFVNSDISDRDMRNAPELKSPSKPLIFLLLSLYTFAGIPLLYMILKRSGKRELAWVALPGVAAGFTGIFAMMGAMNRPTATFAQHRELIAGTLNSPYMRSHETFSVYNGAAKQVLFDVPSRGTTMIRKGSITSDYRVSGIVDVPQWAMATTSVESPSYDLGGSVNLSLLPNGDFTVTNNTNFTLAGPSLGRRLSSNVGLGTFLKSGQSVTVKRGVLLGPGSPGQPSFDVGWGFTLNDQIESGFSDHSAVIDGSDYYFKARIMDVPSGIKLDGKPLKIVRSQRMLFLRCGESGLTK